MCGVQLFSLLGLLALAPVKEDGFLAQSQQFTGVSGGKRSTREEDSEPFWALRLQMEKTGRGLCVHVDFFITGTGKCLLYYATVGRKTSSLEWFV